MFQGTIFLKIISARVGYIYVHARAHMRAHFDEAVLTHAQSRN